MKTRTLKYVIYFFIGLLFTIILAKNIEYGLLIMILGFFLGYSLSYVNASEIIYALQNTLRNFSKGTQESVDNIIYFDTKEELIEFADKHPNIIPKEMLEEMMKKFDNKDKENE